MIKQLTPVGVSYTNNLPFVSKRPNVDKRVSCIVAFNPVEKMTEVAIEAEA